MRLRLVLICLLAAGCADDDAPPCPSLNEFTCPAQPGCHGEVGSAYVCSDATTSGGPACDTLDQEACALRDDCETHLRNICQDLPPPCDGKWVFDRCTAE
jgi:hypothetical protein